MNDNVSHNTDWYQPPEKRYACDNCKEMFDAEDLQDHGNQQYCWDCLEGIENEEE